MWQVTPLSKKFEFHAHNSKQIIQNFCSEKWFGTSYWQWDKVKISKPSEIKSPLAGKKSKEKSAKFV